MVSIPALSPPLDEITTALLDLLDLSGFTRAGEQGWDGAFGGNPKSPIYPYWILYAIPGGVADPMPDLDMRLDETTAVWQVTAVSPFRNQAQRLARVCRDLVLGRNDHGFVYPIAVPFGWEIADRQPDAAHAGVMRAGDPPNAIFSAPIRFTLTVAPI